MRSRLTPAIAQRGLRGGIDGPLRGVMRSRLTPAIAQGGCGGGGGFSAVALTCHYFVAMEGANAPSFSRGLINQHRRRKTNYARFSLTATWPAGFAMEAQRKTLSHAPTEARWRVT